MNCRKNIMNRAGVLFLTAVLFFSATAVTANATLPTGHKISDAQSNGHQNRGNVIWDNGGYKTNALSSQLDTQYPFQSQVADDFEFSSLQTISEVICYGLFTNGGPINPIDLNVIIYLDDGTGNQPVGSGMADPTAVALVVDFHHGVGVDNHDGTYTYDMVLTMPFVAQANEKYWIVFQEVGAYPPQWGWCVSGSQTLHYCMQGAPSYGIPYWTDPIHGDVAFQLLSQPTQPDLVIWTSTSTVGDGVYEHPPPPAITQIGGSIFAWPISFPLLYIFVVYIQNDGTGPMSCTIQPTKLPGGWATSVSRVIYPPGSTPPTTGLTNAPVQLPPIGTGGSLPILIIIVKLFGTIQVQLDAKSTSGLKDSVIVHT